VPFGLDDSTYFGAYRDLISLPFSDPAVADQWSVEAIEKQVQYHIRELASSKANEMFPDYTRLAKAWIANLSAPIPSRKIYLPIHGLSVMKPFQISNVTLLPLQDILDIKPVTLSEQIVKGMHQETSCIAMTMISAEERRAVEKARLEVEYILNILRYIGSLLWHNQPLRHLYIGGRAPKRTTKALSVVSSKPASLVSLAEYTPLAYTIDDDFHKYAELYDFRFILDLIANPSPPALVRAFLLAIQWYGDALQDFTDIFAFTKFYISIETTVKRKKEKAKSVVPRRLSVLIEPHIREKQQMIENDLGELVDERNNIFHAGKPGKKSIEYLSWFSRIMAMQCLHKIRGLLKSDGWQTKDDLVEWVDQNFDLYLSKSKK
jgi:hypothetical protein